MKILTPFSVDKIPNTTGSSWDTVALHLEVTCEVAHIRGPVGDAAGGLEGGAAVARAVRGDEADIVTAAEVLNAADLEA